MRKIIYRDIEKESILILLNVMKLEKKIMCRFEKDKDKERKYVVCVIKC